MVLRLILTLLLLTIASVASARDRIVAVQSISIPPYEEAVTGFSEVCPISLSRIFLTDTDKATLANRIARKDTDLILAVGLDALKALEGIHDVPIVYVMSLCPECGFAGRENVTGVNMSPSVAVQFQKIREILPEIRHVGVVFDPAQTGRYIQDATASAQSLGMEILAGPVTTARTVPSKLLSIRDRVELIWMVPDVTVMTSQTIEYFILFSMENRIPLVAFSEKYLRMGVFMAFGLDPVDMGRQAGEMANLILSGTDPGKISIQDARTVSVTVNRTMAKKFGIRLDDALLNTVGIVE
jgi:putative tryptophan/tyrosine transport system substrate-binding protein